MSNKVKRYEKIKAPKRKKVRGRTSRILRRAKISDFKLKKIIHCYAEGLTAAQTNERVNVSTTRIYVLFGLIRRRMTLLKVYPDPLLILNNANDISANRISKRLTESINALKGERRGIRKENIADHAAEIAYRLLMGNLPAQRHYEDIMLAIRYAGPLNATKQPNERYADLKVLRHIAQTLPTLARLAPRYPEARRYMNELLELSLLIEQKPGVHRHRSKIPRLDSDNEEEK